MQNNSPQDQPAPSANELLISLSRSREREEGLLRTAEGFRSMASEQAKKIRFLEQQLGVKDALILELQEKLQSLVEEVDTLHAQQAHAALCARSRHARDNDEGSAIGEHEGVENETASNAGMSDAPRLKELHEALRQKQRALHEAYSIIAELSARAPS